MISRRNLIVAVMGMVGSFLGVAAIYMLLYAQFLAVLQMLVYAGAIMVLFVFVIMILNRPEDEPVAPTGHVGQVVGGIAILYLIGRLVDRCCGRRAAEQGRGARRAEGDARSATTWGSVNAVGTDLFNGGLFPFEAISILLLVARGRRDRDRPAAARRRHHRRGTRMNDLLFDVGYGHFLVLAAVLFLIGMAGVLIRRNALIMLMSVELMLNAANITLVTFSRMWADESRCRRTRSRLIVIGVAAAEARSGSRSSSRCSAAGATSTSTS